MTHDELVRAILTHSGVLLLFSSEALGIAIQRDEVDDWRTTNAGHAGARFVSQRCWRSKCMWEHEAANSF